MFLSLAKEKGNLKIQTIIIIIIIIIFWFSTIIIFITINCLKRQMLSFNKSNGMYIEAFYHEIFTKRCFAVKIKRKLSLPLYELFVRPTK
jgi:hypothetical protein